MIDAHACTGVHTFKWQFTSYEDSQTNFRILNVNNFNKISDICQCISAVSYHARYTVNSEVEV